MKRVCIGVGGRIHGILIPANSPQSRCDACRYENQRQRDLLRGTPAQRGYDAAYRRARLGVLEEADGICHWCGRPGADTADHLIPTSCGGSSDRDNLVAAHRSCNSVRGGRLTPTKGT